MGRSLWLPPSPGLRCTGLRTCVMACDEAECAGIRLMSACMAAFTHRRILKGKASCSVVCACLDGPRFYGQGTGVHGFPPCPVHGLRLTGALEEMPRFPPLLYRVY